MMHRREYYQPLPITPNDHRLPIPLNQHRRHKYQSDYNLPCYPGMPHYPPPQPTYDIYSPRAHHPKLRERAAAPPLHFKHQPTAPPYHYSYDNHYNLMYQPPSSLWPNEIEVKSIGTQSNRKMSILSKLKLKIQPLMMPEDDHYIPNTCFTQTEVETSKESQGSKLTKPLFTWKSLQTLAMKLDEDNVGDNPMKYSIKAQEEIATGGQKIRNVMMKKMFYKRNPFSSRNLLVRTMLSRDKSTFSSDQNKPKIFF